MQRCPYIHEMRERLLDQPRETLQLENMERANLLENRQSASESNQLQGDTYHTSPAHQRTPLVPHDLGEDFNLDFDEDYPIDVRRPKNANGKHPPVLMRPQPRSDSAKYLSDLKTLSYIYLNILSLYSFFRHLSLLYFR
ncbi:uncharacterized protein [Drosophila bipectinata]|uniref:uncharacterized protein isoform X2 n=1 Tax=Drosophila bipectinata TaxID=42026 RepID=UPI0038B3D11B